MFRLEFRPAALRPVLSDGLPFSLIKQKKVPTPLIGNDAFQEADVIGITRPVTKHNYQVKDVKDLARILKQAFYIARTGRPGPVLVDLPKDVQMATASFRILKALNFGDTNHPTAGMPGRLKKPPK